ncbi:oligopeptide/dipeptide ABC transporter, ATP-binding protein domain [Clostridium thermobutyricum]|uniref:Oligopeptide/dipeptide ABC transporter, ATP-binding protein domain n=1 Tax=Clostridium thermobutyricum TaxID=29372 RepID=N9WJH7_9CLOT|nr:ABC transporter ATP-binding protein [Clostridium thermobutyricum]ENZ03256.1 oligopeptide/dipeptide ABC transporter, ATP-binding protein domain [Clostridium thermobutyricum]
MLEIKDLFIDIESHNGTVNAVRGVSLNVKRKELLAIVGESGCGKSILCRSIIKLLPKGANIKSGEIIVNGKHVENMSEKDAYNFRGKDVGVIFQNPMTALNPTITIGNQITEALLVHKNISKKEAIEEAIKLMELVGIDYPRERFNQYPHEFSGGMRQRIVIAIAVSCKPELVIADEPTTALDVTIQKQILDLLVHIKRDHNSAVVLVSHDLGVVSSVADKVAIMYAGKILEVGKTNEIFSNPQHPYTKGLLNSLPSFNEEKEYLDTIGGIPPSLINPLKGDPFAERNKKAFKIDFKEDPPKVKISDTHFVYSWEAFYEKNKDNIEYLEGEAL